MTYLIDIVLSIVLLLAGYVGVCWYFSDRKITEIKNSVLKITKKKVGYLVVGCLSTAAVILSLNLTYHVDLVSRINLIALVLLLLPLAAIDTKVQKVPNIFLLVGLAVRVVLIAVLYIINMDNAWQITKDSLIGALVIGLFFLFLLVAFKNSIGMGDVKLFALMGLYQGIWGVINSVFFALLVSFFVSVTLLISRKKKKKDTIPFVPSIYIGTIIAICMAGI